LDLPVQSSSTALILDLDQFERSRSLSRHGIQEIGLRWIRLRKVLDVQIDASSEQEPLEELLLFDLLSVAVVHLAMIRS